MAFRPLAGVRVLDLSRLLPGPFLSQLLADLGADVVKVEEPGFGDPARLIPPEVDGAGYAFSAVNRGKRSVALDLKNPAGIEVARRLAARADVFLESFRPGVLDRLGLGDDDLARLNPRLVRVSLVGHPPGPLRDAPGHDINYESVAGILAAQGGPDAPMPGAVPLADLAGALYGATGLLAALLERERTGRGARVEVALSDAALACHVLGLQRAAGEAPLPARGAWELAGGLPSYRVHRCADGRFVALGALESRFWDRFVEAAGEPSLAPLHLDGSPDAHRRVEAVFARRTRDEWTALAAAAGVPLTPVLEPGEAWREARARLGGVPGAGTPLTGTPSQGRVPTPGEDAEHVLQEAGFTQDEQRALRRAGAFGPVDP